MPFIMLQLLMSDTDYENREETEAIWLHNKAIVHILQDCSTSVFFGNTILLNYIRYCVCATSSLGSLLLMDLSSLLLKYACNYCDSNYNYCIIQINLIPGLDHPD